jgi:hypothetical protein
MLAKAKAGLARPPLSKLPLKGGHTLWQHLQSHGANVPDRPVL